MFFHVVTVHPNLLTSYLDGSILGRAREAGDLTVSFYNPWDYSPGGHKNVDGKPYGGGPGMVQKALPFMKAVEKAVGRKKDVAIVLFTPGIKKFTGTLAEDLASTYRHIVLVCGHYEGIDARLHEMIADRYGEDHVYEISIGDFVLTGGELPALVVIDTVARFVPGVLGNTASLEEKRASSTDVYTRPEVITYKNKRYNVPDVLLTGNHKDINAWRKENRKKRTNDNQ